jgi:hypothetical protein
LSKDTLVADRLVSAVPGGLQKMAPPRLPDWLLLKTLRAVTEATLSCSFVQIAPPSAADLFVVKVQLFAVKVAPAPPVA